MSFRPNDTLKRVQKGFHRVFEAQPAQVFHAPGRVNLIGEHTDYNDGFVLPCALPCGTVIAARPRSDQVARVVALDYEDAVDEFELKHPISPRPDLPWTMYVRGIFHALLTSGYALSGVELAIGGDVPQGAGLSSSASLQVGLGTALSELNELALTPVEIALLAQKAENEYVGCQCGVMDQMASALGQAGHALLLDCRSLETTSISMPSEMTLLIINSNVRRGLVDSEYNVRRKECQEAARAMGVSSLRDARLAQLEASREKMSSVTYRRARHVITENQRTLEATQALRAGDLSVLGALMRESHLSLRDDFEVTVPPVDWLFDALSELIGDRGGVRMTGGGFGGCLIAALPHSLVETASDLIQKHYPAETGLHADLYEGEASAGARRCLLEELTHVEHER